MFNTNYISLLKGVLSKNQNVSLKQQSFNHLRTINILPLLLNLQTMIFFNFCVVLRSKFVFPGQACIHCRNFQSSDMGDIVKHCRTCVFMPRPDAFRCKFVCYACRSFSTYNITTMKNHINVHLGEKPYKCPICGYRAVEKKNVRTHMIRIHGIDERKKVLL